MKFKEIFEAKEKEFFFNDDEDSIDELMKYVEEKYSDKEVEMYIGRGDDIAHGCKVMGKALKDKKLLELIDVVFCDEVNPEDCY